LDDHKGVVICAGSHDCVDREVRGVAADRNGGLGARHGCGNDRDSGPKVVKLKNTEYVSGLWFWAE
jgi:hypothetical protein